MTAHADPSLHAVLRAKGYRLTPQRQLVLEAVGQIGHATPEQVLAVVQRTAVGVNVTTVYRTLSLLEDLGLVRHTHLSHGASTFSLVSEDEHVHLVCRECSDVQEVPVDALAGFASQLLQQQGFHLDIGHTSLFGTCAACSGTTP